MNRRFWVALALMVSALCAPAVVEAQTISTEPDCNGIGGNWDFAAQRPQFARCVLDQYFQVQPGSTLLVDIGVEMVVNFNGHLDNHGRIELPNTAKLTIAGGTLSSRGTLYANNRAEIEFSRGRVINDGQMDIEGDVFNVNTTVHNGNVRECWSNQGTLRLYSGGNLFNRGGCITSFGGVLEVEPTATWVNESGALYAGGERDTIDGVLENDSGSTVLLRNARVGGQVTNNGVMIVRERRNAASSEGSRFWLTETGQMTIASRGVLYVGTARLQVDGALSLVSGKMLELPPLSNIEVGSSGQIVLTGIAEAWSVNNMLTVLNHGFIQRQCLSVWYPTPVHNGIPVMYQSCRPNPFPPYPYPLPITLP